MLGKLMKNIVSRFSKRRDESKVEEETETAIKSVVIDSEVKKGKLKNVILI